jgi:hypothetical protein
MSYFRLPKKGLESLQAIVMLDSRKSRVSQTDHPMIRSPHPQAGAIISREPGLSPEASLLLARLLLPPRRRRAEVNKQTTL